MQEMTESAVSCDTNKTSKIKKNKTMADVRIAGWETKDKQRLLRALKKCGSANIEGICEELPKKTREEICTAIEYYRTRAQVSMRFSAAHLTTRLNSRRRLSKVQPIPLAQWAQELTENFPYDELRTETAEAFRLISKHEYFPEPNTTAYIDFKAIYQYVANAMDGRALPEISGETAKVIEKCLVEVALKCKGANRMMNYKHFIKLIKSINQFRPTTNIIKIDDDTELDCIRHLEVQKAYNPLSIPEHYLKSYSVMNDTA